MSNLYIIFSLLFFMFVLGNVELYSIKDSKKAKSSYEACIRLKIKAPYFNLKCENLLKRYNNNIPEEETNPSDKENEGKPIQMLYFDKTETRKLNKREEIQLRKLIEQLTRKNQKIKVK